jgi:hypothetical protein
MKNNELKLQINERDLFKIKENTKKESVRKTLVVYHRVLMGE